MYKGPQKEYYQNRIRELNPTFTHISIQTLWLTSSDYPLFIGSADLGISLHTSTSGIDLPMKVLDMMGCHVPVCAISFQCVDELVLDHVNGKVFGNEMDLAKILLDVFAEKEWRDGLGMLGKWREGIGSMKRWKENWNVYARSVILGACGVKANSQMYLHKIFWRMSLVVLFLSVLIAVIYFPR